MNYRELLNNEQYDACTTIDGPLLILAGAGSGKTRAITHRIAYMIGEEGVAPWSILAITFTNKAAAEMKERVRELVGSTAENMWISTFHSTCVRILRREIEHLGYRKDFTIYDAYDQKALIRQCMKELDISDKEYKEKDFSNAISSAKDKLIGPEFYSELNSPNFRKKKIADVYSLYQKKLRSNMALDFDDIIMLTVTLFRNFPDVLEEYRRKFRYIMVDEYQDTNKAQYELIYLLAKEHRNLCVVGDDDQSIYQFRGADLRNILEFESDYPDAKVIKLEENYRSVGNILKAANAVIKNNLGRKDKTMRTSNPEGDKIRIYRAFSDSDEGTFVSKETERLVRDGRNHSEFAVLYRTNAQSRIFEESFMRNSIPYKLVGGLKFYDRKEIKDVLAYLRLLNNPFDEVSLRRIINVPKRGIGDASLEKLSLAAGERDMSIYDILMDIEEYNLFSGKILNSLIGFRNLINDMMSSSVDMEVQEIITELMERTGYLKEYMNSKNPEDESRIENVEELINAAAEYDLKPEANLPGFLEEVALISDVDRYDDEADAVTMMTVHSAKGLEFPVVFMVGMENGIFPGQAAFDSLSEMEESRRLAYVGITRAKEILYMTHSEMRMVFGRSMMYPQSDFIKDIPEELKDYLNKEEVKDESYGKFLRNDRGFRSGPHGINEPIKVNPVKRKTDDTLENFLTEDNAVPGKKVIHPKFGEGLIVGATKEKSDVKLQIVFDNYGLKVLLLSLAPLKLSENQ